MEDEPIIQCIGEPTDPTNIVIFGAGGDLTKRKLIPALVKMLRCGLLHPDSKIIGVLKDRTHEVWLNTLHQGMLDYAPDIEMSEQQWQSFSARFKMVDGDLKDDQTFLDVASSLESLAGHTHAMFYCAVPPTWYTTIAAGLHKIGLAEEKDGFRRVVIEKPFGMDLQSFKKLKLDIHLYNIKCGST